MALIDNLYIHCTSEKITRGLSITDHAVETGLSITDCVKREPIELSLTGYIVNVNNKKSADIVNSLYSKMKSGSLVKFTGCYILSNALITSFDTEYTNKVNGGCGFTMTIKEVRIAKKAYTGSSAATVKQVTSKKTQNATRYYTVKSGDCLWNIAKKYYGSGSQWVKIYNANKKVIGSNPNLIYPNQKFEIPY